MRRKYKLPPQVVRIVLLAGAIVGSYLLARAVLTPPSFKEYGFFRGAALSELSSREPVFAGRVACEECHEDEVKALASHDHKSLSCEGCHGAGKAHSGNPDVKMQVPAQTHCLRCHEANVSRPKWHKQIMSADHYSDSKCTECHVPHMPKEVP
jgi:hypothetical protein